jgi:hypothetical protein
MSSKSEARVNAAEVLKTIQFHVKCDLTMWTENQTDRAELKRLLVL